MCLLSNKTLWLFLLSCSKEPEIRHIYDVANGVACLENKGISPQNICLIIDGNDETIKGHLSQFVKHSYTINKSKHLKSIIKENKKDNIVVFVNGHGASEKGLDSKQQLKPYDLLKAIRCNKEKTKNIVIYLGQCYAGIFNYVNVTENPTTIIIGATNLYPSISCQLPNISWEANLFLYNLFNWIKAPIDIDGDNKNTVIDSYKYVGAETNKYCHKYKGQCFEETLNLLNQKKLLNEAIINSKNKDEQKTLILKIKIIQNEIQKTQIIHYNIQEPWILNAIPAQKIEF